MIQQENGSIIQTGSKGCLSGISVGGGTNNNEAFHRHIRTFFHKSRIGVLLAYAMMMTIICHFNSNDPHSRRAIHRPISLSSSGHNITGLEKMGIMDMDDKNDDETWIQDQLQGEDDMDPELINTILTISSSG